MPSSSDNSSAPAPLNTIYINYTGEISSEKMNKLMAVVTEAKATYSPDTFYFLFSSYGGSVDAGIHFYNFLKSLPQKIIMHNIGSIDSIANVVFLSGDERYATEHSSFHLHGVTWTLQAASYTRLQLREFQSGLEQAERKIAGIYMAHSNLLEEDILGLFTQGESKDSHFALEKGFITSICDANIPPDMLFLSCNF